MEIHPLVVLIAFSIGLSRQLVLKPCANVLNPHENSALGAAFVLLASVVMFPWFGDRLVPVHGIDTRWSMLAVAGLIKGAVWWRQFQAFQAVQKVSASSAGMFVVLGFVMVGAVNSFLGEALSWNQWLSIAAIAVVTGAYCYWGHARTLTAEGYRHVALMVGLLVVAGMIDYFVLSQAHWYFYLVFTTLGIGSCVLWQRLPVASVRKMISTPAVWRALIVLSTTEVLLMNILVSHIPVAVYGVVARAAVPVVMLIAALYWHEGNWKRQLLFGVLGWLCLLPLLW